MMKKILFWLLIVFNSLLMQGQITLTTTSSSGTWSPSTVTKAGATLHWEATNALIGTLTQDANDPTFNFSTNDGTPIDITVSSSDGFGGLTALSFNGELESGDINDIDIGTATTLIDFGMNYNNLSSLDLTQNVALESLNIRGNQQLPDQTLDISNNLSLKVLEADNSGINAVDVSNNTQINNIKLFGAGLTSEVMDQLLIDLNSHGLSNGNIEIRSQKGGDVLTYQSRIAYLNLISKGWSIDVSEPPAEDIKTITLTTNTTSAAWRLDRVYNYGAVLHWEATNSLIGTITADQYDNEIAPTFDFGSNDGSPITITITSNEGFNALDQLNLNNEVGNINSGITNVNITNAINLGSYAPFNSSLMDINVSNNSKLYRILIHGDVRQLVGQILNTDNNPDINHVRIDNTGIISVDFTNNPLLLRVWLMNASLTSSVMDNVVITLDQHGLSNGDLRLASQTTGNQLTSASYNAYKSLEAKGWIIDVAAPPAPPTLEMTGNGNLITSGNTASTADGTDFEDVVINVLLAHSFTITNSGDEDLIITAVTVMGATEFTTDLTAQTITAGASLDFEATFLPTVTGQIGADIVIDNNDSNFTLHVEGRGIIGTGSDIDIQGGNPLTSIPGDGTNTPSTAVDTDFGQAAAGGIISKTFTIVNSGNEPLDLIGSPDLIAITGANASDFTISIIPTTPVAVGATTVFEVTFNANSLGIRTAIITVESNDPNDPSYIFNIQAESTQASGQEINVTGNGQSIPSGNTPIIADYTDFGQVAIGSPITHTFTIENLGDSDLLINYYYINGVDYSLSPNFSGLITLSPEGTPVTLDVTFNPLITGSKSGTITIGNTDLNEDPYIINLTAIGVDAIVEENIIITQYYEGGGDNQWIEIKNISGGQINAGEYYLCLFDYSLLPITGQLPTASVPIPALTTDQVVLFKNSAATLPQNTGVTPESSDGGVCSFSGNDVILISRTNDGTCYANRQDIIGDPNGISWGAGTSFIRGGGASETPDIAYVKSNWIDLENTGIVDAAVLNSNIALGTQNIGGVIWDNGAWVNGIADRTRNVVISAPYSANDGTFEAYSLTINAELNFDQDTEESVVVYGDLTINSPFTFSIGDKESLVIYNDNSIITGDISKFEKSTPLADIHDNTYWSSSITNATIGTVFSGVDPNRIFYLDPGISGLFQAPYTHWIIAQGPMEPGRGYAAEGYSTGTQVVTFTGKPNNGRISIPVGYKGSDDVGNENDNFNLLGNPYPCTISLKSFLSNTYQLDSLDQTIYLWNHRTVNSDGEYSGDDYASWNTSGGTAGISGGEEPNGFLSSGQGFMIRTIGNQGSVRFENSDKVVGKDYQFFKETKSKDQGVNKNKKDRIWLNLTTEDGGFSQILVGFFDNATDGKDRLFDGLKIKSGNQIAFYSVIEKYKYVIQGLSSFSTDKTVVLGFDTEISKNFTISINKIEGALKDTEVYLVDHLLNITHDLKASDYNFEQTTIGSFPDRFTLQFAGQALDVDDEIFTKNEFIISNDVESLKIRSAKEVKDIKVYDLLGRMILQKQPNKKSFNIHATNIKNGTVLVIKATLENGSVVSKKIIRY